MSSSEGAYGAMAVQDLLRARVKAQLEAEDRQFRQSMDLRNADRQDAQLREQTLYRQSQEADKVEQQRVTNEDKAQTQAFKLGDLVKPGEQPYDPSVSNPRSMAAPKYQGQLRSVGLIDDTKARPAVDEGPLQEGDTGRAIGVTKLASAGQENVLADNERQAAANKQTAAHQEATEKYQQDVLKQTAIRDANTAKHQGTMEARMLANGAGASGAGSNVKEMVAGMKDGTLPPVMPGRASKEYVALNAEAHRQGYNLGEAATDWAATQKHVAALNGNQQLRLNQSINALPDLFDKVDELASKWKGGSFPPLNKANLLAAKNGAYGPDVASVAVALEAQIADVTSDLAVVYMGGNSPTDHGLALASKSLNGDWNEKVLHDMVKLGKTNVTIRQNSIKNTGVSGASAHNPYAGAAPKTDTQGGGEMWTRDANGKLVKGGK